jgi:trimeric autotransporter adhesin
LKVSWQVTGIRHDAYAEAHPSPVEVQKPAEARGHYLHPEVFGASQDKTIGAH